jgi:hypothetical protein
MVLNEYRLEIQFKKVWKVRNINNIPMVRSRPLECRPAQNGLYMVFELVQILVRSQILSRLLCNSCSHYIITLYLYNNCDYFLNCVYPNPPCQLSLWEETGAPGENPRLSAER